MTIALCEAKPRGITGWIPHKSDLLGSWLACPLGSGKSPYCRQDETRSMCDTGCFSGGITPQTHFVNETLQIWYTQFHFDLLQNLWTGCYKICDAVMACVKIRFRDWGEPQLFNIMDRNTEETGKRMDRHTDTHHSCPLLTSSAGTIIMTSLPVSLWCWQAYSASPVTLMNLTE